MNNREGPSLLQKVAPVTFVVLAACSTAEIAEINQIEFLDYRGGAPQILPFTPSDEFPNYVPKPVIKLPENYECTSSICNESTTLFLELLNIAPDSELGIRIHEIVRKNTIVTDRVGIDRLCGSNALACYYPEANAIVVRNTDYEDDVFEAQDNAQLVLHEIIHWFANQGGKVTYGETSPQENSAVGVMLNQNSANLLIAQQIDNGDWQLEQYDGRFSETIAVILEMVLDLRLKMMLSDDKQLLKFDEYFSPENYNNPGYTRYAMNGLAELIQNGADQEAIDAIFKILNFIYDTSAYIATNETLSAEIMSAIDEDDPQRLLQIITQANTGIENATLNESTETIITLMETESALRLLLAPINPNTADTMIRMTGENRVEIIVITPNTEEQLQRLKNFFATYGIYYDKLEIVK